MTGPASLPAMTQFLIDSVSETTKLESGELVKIPDLDKIQYRLLQIDSNNFGAFIQKAEVLKIWADTLNMHTTPRTAASIRQIVSALMRTYQVGLTGKSSEQGGRLIRDLLEERTESVINVHEKHNSLSRFRQFTGEREPDTQPVQTTGVMR